MSAADCIMIGAGAWAAVALAVVWWLDRKIRSAPPDPDDVATALREPQQDEESPH